MKERRDITMNLVIVDDEPVICNGLSTLIEKNDWGWKVVGIFSDAEEALETCDWDQVQVALLDIDMPNIDGLTLTHLLRERGFKTNIIFITAHARFDYAQRAVKEDALEYLLKPVSKLCLEDALNKAEIAYRKQVEREEDPEYIKENMLYLRKNFFSDFLFEERMISAQEMRKREKQYFLEGKTYGLCCLASQKTKKEIKQLLEKNCDKQIDWYVYGQEYFFVVLFLYNRECGQEANAINVIMQVEKLRYSYQMSIDDIMRLPQVYKKLLVDVREFYREIEKKEVLEPEKNNTVLESAEISISVRQAMKFIEENLNKPLSLQKIAMEVYLHPTYLSNIFKKQTGYTIINYINRCRINEAQKLLNDPQNRVSWVMEQVGFVNQRYFGKVFKEIVGVTPTNYKLKTFMKSEELES